MIGWHPHVRNGVSHIRSAGQPFKAMILKYETLPVGYSAYQSQPVIGSDPSIRRVVDPKSKLEWVSSPASRRYRQLVATTSVQEPGNRSNEFRYRNRLGDVRVATALQHRLFVSILGERGQRYAFQLLVSLDDPGDFET